jgi:hypothetical protein
MAWLLPLETLKEAQSLARRYQEGKALRLYVHERLRLVIPVGLLIVVISVTCAVAALVFLGDIHPLLALPGLLLLPVILIGSLLVQFYVFFSWLENRALARALARRSRPAPGPVARWLHDKAGVDLGSPPPMPWVLATLTLFVPLVMLASFALEFALGLVALAILAPLVYARLER